MLNIALGAAGLIIFLLLVSWCTRKGIKDHADHRPDADHLLADEERGADVMMIPMLQPSASQPLVGPSPAVPIITPRTPSRKPTLNQLTQFYRDAPTIYAEGVAGGQQQDVLWMQESGLLRAATAYAAGHGALVGVSFT